MLFRSVSQSRYGLRDLEVKKWVAVDGARIDLTEDDRVSFRVKRNIAKNLRRSWEDIHTLGAVGCYLSHVGVWKWLAQSNAEACVVLEDDCVVPGDFGEKLRRLWEQSGVIRNSRFDICVLHRRCGEVEGNGVTGDEEKLEALKSFHNTTAYIITRGCAKKLLEEVFPIQVHVDRMIGLYKSVYGLRVYRVKEDWLNITSSGSKSDIDDNYCEFCDIPSDFNAKYRVMGKTDFILGRLAQIVGGVLLVSWLIGGGRG